MCEEIQIKLPECVIKEKQFTTANKIDFTILLKSFCLLK